MHYCFYITGADRYTQPQTNLTLSEFRSSHVTNHGLTIGVQYFVNGKCRASVCSHQESGNLGARGTCSAAGTPLMHASYHTSQALSCY